VYHLLVKYEGWADGQDRLTNDRVFESTESALIPRTEGGTLDFARLPSGPALFATEEGGSGPMVARIGTIRRARATGRWVHLEYVIDPQLPSLPIASLRALSSDLSIESFELRHTHWAMKDVDLFRVLLLQKASLGPSPTLFDLDAAVEADLVSVMMPFDPGFDPIHAAICQAVSDAGMRCLRADDIWVHDVIIQDIVSLICRSRIVISDCTGRNPNVFYETGIAHTLGRDVLLIGQSEGDIPFDLRHLRFIRYLNNGEGRAQLTSEVARRVMTLASR